MPFPALPRRRRQRGHPLLCALCYALTTCLLHALLSPALPCAEGGSEATRALLGDYATPARFATPMRTPARTPAVGGQARLMQEAQNLIHLQTGQTPLLGGENPELHPSGEERGGELFCFSTFLIGIDLIRQRGVAPLG